MANTLEGFTMTRIEFPRERPIGASQIRVELMRLAVLELTDTPGHGIRLAAAARQTYHQPEISDVSGATPPLSRLTQPS